ncbi:MAG: STAS/SEC14 domain-containing protein [Bacteroidota bacterium]
MKPPVNTQVTEGELASFWFDENGILYALSKSTPRTLEKQKENYALIRRITKNKKVCLLSDTTTASQQDEVTTTYMIKEIPNLFIAMAIISDSALGRFTVNHFLTTNHQPIPIKYFTNEKEAKEWLKKYL